MNPAPWQIYRSKGEKWHLQLTVRTPEALWQLSSQLQTQAKAQHTILIIPFPPPLYPPSHLWRKQRQADEGEKHPEVLLSMLDIIAHPHHQSLEDGFLFGHVDVIAGEQLNDLSRGEQQELLVLNDLQEVFLEHRGDVEEADNHQSLAEG